jgi:hypothetical protein
MISVSMLLTRIRLKITLRVPQLIKTRISNSMFLSFLTSQNSSFNKFTIVKGQSKLVNITTIKVNKTCYIKGPLSPRKAFIFISQKLLIYGALL